LVSRGNGVGFQPIAEWRGSAGNCWGSGSCWELLAMGICGQCISEWRGIAGDQAPIIRVEFRVFTLLGGSSLHSLYRGVSSLYSLFKGVSSLYSLYRGASSLYSLYRGVSSLYRLYRGVSSLYSLYRGVSSLYSLRLSESDSESSERRGQLEASQPP
jgi:hypothetical protein